MLQHRIQISTLSWLIIWAHIFAGIWATLHFQHTWGLIWEFVCPQIFVSIPSRNTFKCTDNAKIVIYKYIYVFYEKLTSYQTIDWHVIILHVEWSRFLHYNKLSRVPDGLFTSLHFRTRVTLDGNPWVCIPPTPSIEVSRDPTSQWCSSVSQ